VQRSGAGFGVAVPKPGFVSVGERSVAQGPVKVGQAAKGELPLSRPTRNAAKPECCGGSGIGLFVLIAIIAALIAMNSARRANRRMSPPPAPRPVERYWEKARSTSSRLVPASEVERARIRNEVLSKVFEQRWVRVEGKTSKAYWELEMRVDPVIARAKAWLERVEADRGAVDKSRDGAAPREAAGGHP
jgi:hypothetical protein